MNLMKNVTKNGFEGAYSNTKSKPRLMILPKQKSKKDGTCVVYIELSVTKETASNLTSPTSKKRIQRRVATDIRVLPKFWSMALRKVKEAHPDHVNLNRKLKAILIAVDGYADGKIIDAVYLKELPVELQTFERHFDQKQRKTLIQWLDDYIKHRKAKSVRGTWKEFVTLRGRLERIQLRLNRMLYFESINFEFGDQIRDWADSNDIDPNTCKKTFAALGTFLNHYYNDQIKLNFRLSTDFREKKFSAVSGTHEDDPSPLYVDEIERIKNFIPMEGLKYVEMVKDKITGESKPVEKPLTINAQYRIKNLFLLACFTGLRFSDLVGLKKANFVNKTIVIRASKTDKGKSVKTLFIPIIPLANEVLIEIGDDMTKLKLSNQKANLYLTALLKHLAIDTPTIEYKYKMNGDRTEIEKPKYEIVSFHSGRDTFITNMLILGINHIAVMGWSGHTKFETFRKYVKLSENYLQSQHSQANKLFVFTDDEAELKKLGVTRVK